MWGLAELEPTCTDIGGGEGSLGGRWGVEREAEKEGE